MADMGFLPAVRRILDTTAPGRQTILFSATLDGDVATLTQRYQRDPVRAHSDVQEDAAGNVEHHFWKVNRADRAAHVAEVAASYGPAIIFTRTRHGADRLSRQLGHLGVGAVSLHGGRSQQQRNRALKEFATGRAHALVATDVAARGIHVDGVASVIHFDPPEDEKAYVHRSGRTARAGASGIVVSLLDDGQVKTARRMQNALGIDSRVVERQAPRPGSSPVPFERRPERALPAEPTGSIYVGNLPFRVSGPELERMFAKFGKVHSATVVTHRDSRKSRGFGFVEMPRTATRAAISGLNGSHVAGRQLRVRPARNEGHPPLT
jgi:superfamily II DNA/RNA helicase